MTQLDSLVNLYYERHADELKVYDEETKRMEPIWKEFEWNLPEKLGISFDSEDAIEVLHHGMKWTDALLWIIEELYNNQREVWIYFTQRYNILTLDQNYNLQAINQSIQQHILQRYPELTENNIYNFFEFMDGLYWQKHNERSSGYEQIQYTFLTEWANDLNDAFHLKISLDSTIREWKPLSQSTSFLDSNLKRNNCSTMV